MAENNGKKGDLNTQRKETAVNRVIRLMRIDLEGGVLGRMKERDAAAFAG